MFRMIAVSAGLLAVAAVWLSPSLVTSANSQTVVPVADVEVTPLPSDSGNFFGSFRFSLAPKTREIPDGVGEVAAVEIALARGAAIREARRDGRTLTAQEIAAIGVAPETAEEAEAVRVASADPEFDVTVLGLERKPARRPSESVAEVVADTDIPDQGPAEETPAPMWMVTGTTVNLRAGPGTTHEVVSQASLGEMYVPVSDTASDWIEIRLSDGGSTAWIFAKFLQPAEG